MIGFSAENSGKRLALSIHSLFWVFSSYCQLWCCKIFCTVFIFAMWTSVQWEQKWEFQSLMETW